MAKCYNPIYLRQQEMIVNCGKCLSCISNRKKDMGQRMSAELENYKYKIFTTITYDDLNIPTTEKDEYSLNKKHITDYIKVLDINQKRHYRAEGIEAKMKYFIAGEYGEITKRPHYHMVIGSNTGINYNTKILWKYGQIKAEDLISNKAVSYTVGYTEKKQWEKKYLNIESPFHKFSRGIGKEWFEEKWQQGKITAEKYFIETMNYNLALPQYYKYLLRKKYYTYTQDELTRFYGKLKWKNFQNEIQNNIKEKLKEAEHLEERYFIEKFGHTKQYHKFKSELIENINNIKKNHEGEKAWEIIIETMKACKNNRELKKIKAEQEAKFWMKAKLRAA